MAILTRYVLGELAKVFVVLLAGLTLMMIVVGVVREATQQSVPLTHVLRLIPYILPDALRVAVPVTLLLATTCVYGRMSGCNEIVAAKALGISPLTLLWPTYVVACLMSFVTVWLNDVAVSWGRNGARRVVLEAVEEIVYGMLRTQGSYATSHFSISVRRVDGHRLLRPTIVVAAREDSPAVTITAQEAELRADLDQQMLRVLLVESAIEVEGKLTWEDPGVYEMQVPLRDASRAQAPSRLASWLPLWEIANQENKQRELIRVLEEELAARAAFQMAGGDFAALVGEEWSHHARHRKNAYGDLHRLLTEPHRRWSNGFSCLCFAWVGAPLAIWLRNKDFLTSFFLCFLPILIIYYPLMACGVDGAKSGILPPYAVWMGNVLLGLVGVWLLRRALRY